MLPLALRLGWRSADLMWRLAGDTSTDFNHYTKRMTLGAVYASTLLVWLDDQSEGWADTAAFLDRRIDDVMQFEKWKAGVARLGDAAQPQPLPRPAALPAALRQSLYSLLIIIRSMLWRAHGCARFRSLLAVLSLALIGSPAPAARRSATGGPDHLAAARLYRGRLSRGGRAAGRSSTSRI